MLVTVTDRKVEDIGKVVSITGQVFDGTTPVADALVLLTNGPLTLDLSNVIRSSVTDAAGVYIFKYLLPRSYSIAVFRPGSLTPEIFNDVFKDLDSSYIMPGLDTGVSVTTPLVTTPIIADETTITGISIVTAGSGYSSNNPPIITYPGGFVAKAVVDRKTGSVASFTTLGTGPVGSTTPEDNSVVIFNETIAPAAVNSNVVANANSGTGDLGVELNNVYSLVTQELSRLTRRLQDSINAITFGWAFSPVSISGVPGIGGTFGLGYYTAVLQCVESLDPSPITPGHEELNFGVRINMYKSGTLTVYEGNELALYRLLTADYFEYAGGVMNAESGNYFSFDIYTVESTSHPRSLLKPADAPYIGRTVPTLDPELGLGYVQWLDEVFSPFVNKKFGSYSEYAAAKAQVQSAAKSYAISTYSPLQTGDSPESSLSIGAWLSALYNDWQAFVVSHLSSATFMEQQEYYQAVKSKGLALLAAGTITETEYNLGKGFMGRQQFVEPFINGLISNDNFTITPVTGALWAVAGILAWQAKDAVVGLEIIDPVFDCLTQSAGAVAFSPPAWVLNNTFDVRNYPNTGTTTPKRFINGSWQTVAS